MKRYKQVHLICYDRGFKYETVPNTPEFHDDQKAKDYFNLNESRITCGNVYNDPIVIIRREINSVTVKEL
jgi:hypothetical protein